MRVVMDWLGEHVALPEGLTAERLAADLVRVGLEEEAIHAAAVTGPLVVGRVLEMTGEPQKNGKTINWCQVDVGAHNVLDEDGAPTVARGIVCGAHNFTAGDLVVVALPGTVLPGPFAIASRKTYGHVSDGMICSARELGLGEDHDGIIVLPRLGFDETTLAPGQDAVALLGLGDEVLEINITPDRGYCFSYRGIAREYALSTGARFTDPGEETGPYPAPSAEGFGVEVEDEAPLHDVVGCDRFVTRIVRGVDPSAPTPEFIARRLKGAGMRPISLAVDATNYVMLDLGQPLHAYDLASVAAPVVVRRAAPGERLTTLDDVDRALDAEDLLITDSPAGARGSRVLGLAGVMGGASSEVTATTTDVLIEAAHFDPVTVARTARRHKLPSEAAKRFERGVDPALALVAATRVADLLVEYGDGVREEAVGDVRRSVEPEEVLLPWAEPSRLVGVDYGRERIRGTLEAIGCHCVENDRGLVVTPPSWRPDLRIPADLVEEIARVVGYDEIPSILPQAPAGTGLTGGQRIRRSVARTLAEAGWVEALSYPFVGEADHDALRIPVDDERRRAVRLANPLAEDRPFLRTAVLTTLLETLRRNVGRGLVDVALFEEGLVTGPARSTVPALPGAVVPSGAQITALERGVPVQRRHVAGVAAGLRRPAGWAGPGRAVDWTDAVEAARVVADRVGTEIAIVADTDRAPWHPGRCARIEIPVVDGTLVVGYAGELHPKVCEELDLPARAVAFEVDLDAMISAGPDGPVQAVEVRAFPAAKEDMAFVVADDVPAAAVTDALVEGGGDLVESAHLFDVYTGPQVGQGRKSLAFALRLRGDRTLTAEDTNAVRARIVETVRARVGGELRA